MVNFGGSGSQWAPFIAGNAGFLPLSRVGSEEVEVVVKEGAEGFKAVKQTRHRD